MTITSDPAFRFANSLPSFVLTLLDAHRIIYSRTTADGDEAASLVKAVEDYVREYGITKEPHKGGYYWRGIPNAAGRDS